MMKSLFILVAVCMGMAGCTSITVKPVDPALKLNYLCIEENPKVLVTDFADALKEGFARHGIASDVFSGAIPPKCEYVLTYTALRSWATVPYLSQADLRIRKDGKLVAEAEYHLVGKGGFSPAKWQGTKAKMDPVIDELLASYPMVSEEKPAGETRAP